jgi:SAM-dependent methyltransferase
MVDREPAVVRILADAASVPLFDAQFSAVVGFLIDSFIGLAFFAEAYRLLLPGGVLFVTVPAAEWGYSLRGSKEPEVSVARFITKSRHTVLVPSTLITGTRIDEMLRYCGFQFISIDFEPLPPGVTPISPDVETAASSYGVAVHELPLVYLIRASKPVQEPLRV